MSWICYYKHIPEWVSSSRQSLWMITHNWTSYRMAPLYMWDISRTKIVLFAGGSSLEEAFVNTGLAMLNYMTPLRDIPIEANVARWLWLLNSHSWQALIPPALKKWEESVLDGMKCCIYGARPSCKDWVLDLVTQAQYKALFSGSQVFGLLCKCIDYISSTDEEQIHAMQFDFQLSSFELYINYFYPV